jgi:ketosteroid isomerase-like protein
MRNIGVVQRLMDRILVQDLDPALSLLAEDIELTVLPSPASSGSAEIRQGRQAVREYFITLGDIVTFWQVRIVVHGDQVLVLGRERYATRFGLKSDSDFMLACQVRGGRIVRIVVVEDTAATLGAADEPAMRPTVFREMPELDDALLTSLSSALEEITADLRVA